MEWSGWGLNLTGPRIRVRGHGSGLVLGQQGQVLGLIVVQGQPA